MKLLENLPKPVITRIVLFLDPESKINFIAAAKEIYEEPRKEEGPRFYCPFCIFNLWFYYISTNENLARMDYGDDLTFHLRNKFLNEEIKTGENFKRYRIRTWRRRHYSSSEDEKEISWFFHYLDTKFAAAFSCETPGRLLHHMLKHRGYSLYMPPFLAQQWQRTRLPDYINPITSDNLPCVKDHTLKKTDTAVKKFFNIILDMAAQNSVFTPVRLKIGNEIFDSPHTDFYRSFALFAKFWDIEWRFFENNEECAKMYIERIIKFGNSNGVEINSFVPKKSPSHKAFGPYEKLEFVSKIYQWVPRNQRE